MNILFLSRWFPFPPDNGSKIRIYHLLRGLSQRHDVTLLSFSDLPLPSPQSLRQQTVCSEIHVVPWKQYNQQSAKAQLGYFSSKPRSLVDTHSLQMESLIGKTLQHRKYDLIIASQLSMASYYPFFNSVPALFEEMELAVFYDQAFGQPNLLKRLRGQLGWYKLRNYLSRLFQEFNSVTVVSKKEQLLFANHFQAHRNKVEVLPNCIDTVDYQNLPVTRKPKHIIFSGSFTYRPNYQAMQWFLRDVFPLVLSQIPDAQLIITGDHADLPLPEVSNITLAGYVDDIRSLIASCDISIAPLWIGGGTRLKILEAMAAGTPVVSTTKGAEGLLAQHDEHILIADEPQKFAECVIKLLQDSDKRACISSNAVRLVKDAYDWQVVMPRLLHLVEKAAAG